MTVTNEFERDLNDTIFLGRPGRVDMKVFQNTANAGDGYPGLQRAFRNYLHEGGIEKDIQLLGFSIKGDSVDINNAEMQQLSNIGAVTINGTQWGYVGGADQPVKIGDTPTFGGLTVNGNITITGTVDGVNISVHDHSGANQGGTVAHVNTSGKTVNDHHNESHSLTSHTIPITSMPMNTEKITGLGDPTAAQDAATYAFVKSQTAIGCIMMFSGAWTDNDTIPGWYKCDGNNGTVNLVDKFVRGGATSGATGGSDDAVVVSHNHNLKISGATPPSAGTLNVADGSYSYEYIQVSSSGVSGVGANIPVHYTLIFIQRIA